MANLACSTWQTEVTNGRTTPSPSRHEILLETNKAGLHTRPDTVTAGDKKTSKYKFHINTNIKLMS